MEPKFPCLGVKPCCLLMLPALLLLLKNRRVVFLLCRDHVVDDPGEFMSGGRHCFGGTHSSFHSPEVVAQECVASA